MRPSTIPLQRGWAYGPVPSRRFGRSLGVNLLPTGRKLCNFDCVYCQYDATPRAPAAGADLPGADEVLEAARDALRGGACDAITIAGNGEPTLHPAFDHVVAGLVTLRDALAPAASIVLLTNGTRLRDAHVRAALGWIDRTFVKLDAGDEATLRAVDRPRAWGGLPRLIDDVQALGTPCCLQSMFMTGAVDNAADERVAPWLDLVAGLRPVEVHVTTIDRGTTLPGVLPVAAPRLEEIAAAARARGVAARAFPASDEARFAS